MAVKPVMLIIRDGWGIRTMEEGNATLAAHTPNDDRWTRTLERAIVDASGEAVGLIPEQMGNSEVGHLNIGAGRIVYQDITRINIAIREDKLRQMAPLAQLLAGVAERGTNVHLIGLVSDGGVHSHIDHLVALITLAKQRDLNPIIHIITDGRDTPPNSGLGFVRHLEEKMTEIGCGRISTVSGRYYTMDRDKRWERTRQAYDAIVNRQSERRAETATQAIEAIYAENVTDEFIPPIVVGDDEALSIQPGDAIICYNFRADRMRQIVQVLVTPGEIEGWSAEPLSDLDLLTFTEYIEGLPVRILFDKQLLDNTLAEVLSKAGKTQYHSAETEKYPHVTFFFNGREEEPYPGEDRRIIPSPKVATYDLQPEMSATELTDATLERLQSHDDDFVLVNFANPDMVGHTGSLEAAIKACEVVDDCAGKLVDAVVAKGGVAIVTADHGNCERMVELATGEAHTYHTTNPVALFVIGTGYYRLRPRGILADIAPTVLDLLGMEIPAEMTGVSFIETHTP